MIRVTYQAQDYTPEAVAGRYVRVESGTQKRVFRVYECAPVPKGSRTTVGHGGTLREYLTHGDEIPVPVRARARESMTTVLWP